MNNSPCRHNFSSPMRVKEVMKSSSHLPTAVREVGRQARRVLPYYIGNSSSTKWIEQNIQPLSDKLSSIFQIEENLSKRDFWPRRLHKLHKLLTASLVLYRIKLGVRNKQMRKSSELYFIFIFPLYELLSIKIDSSIEVAQNLLWRPHFFGGANLISGLQGRFFIITN